MARLAIAIALLTTVACNSPIALPTIAERLLEPAPPAGERPRVINTRFTCGEQQLLLAEFDDHATLVGPEVEIILQPKPSVSGSLWDNGDITFWKGTSAEAVYDYYGETMTCRELPDPWKNAARGGIDFRGVGQEPGWFVEIDEDRMIRLVYDYAERELTTRAPSKTIAPTRTVFAGEAGEQKVAVTIEARRCADAMSGEPYPFAVTVLLDAPSSPGEGSDGARRELRGCGRNVK